MNQGFGHFQVHHHIDRSSSSWSLSPACIRLALFNQLAPSTDQTKTYNRRIPEGYMMPDEKSDVFNSLQRQRALSRWDNEGGAIPERPQDALIEGKVEPEHPELTNAELVQLRIRVIALENLLIALLAEASDRQLDLVREMAAYISPRRGAAQHPLTIHAAAQMIDLVERASHFRGA
ncbi:MAG: hypothetical protein JJE37_14975 [Methyloceanibacter sp.]|nr:hypothetical protein [Methyloceanibacter sp.]